MLKHRPGRQTWIWPSEAVFIRQNNYPLYPGHPFRTQLLRAGARMLCEKDRKRDSDTEQRIHYFDGVLPFPVIQSFGKNVLWEKRESAIWHKAKNLLHWWHFTAFLLTVIDPSRSFRMMLNVPLIIAPCRPLSFWTGQECHMRRQESGIVTQNEESITRMTYYRLPHHDNRSFTFVQDDA